MKKKFWLILYISIILLTLVGVLIFATRKDDNPVSPSDDIEQEEDTGEEDSGGDENNNDPIYATSFIVNLPSAINIQVGRHVELLPGFVCVQPQEMVSKITTEIKPRYSSSVFGIELDNTKILAKEVGTYNLIISVPRSETTTFNKTILITTYEESENAHISLINDQLIKSEPVSLLSIFNIKQNSLYQIETNNNLTFNDNYLTATNTGMNKLVVGFTEGYVCFVYEFELRVVEQPDYYFTFTNISNNLIEIDMNATPISELYYEIINRLEGDVPQEVTAIIENEEIARVETNVAPLIVIKALKAGTTKLVLTSLADSSVCIEILIVIR